MTHLEIEAFLTIAKYGCISRAAEGLFVTQSALSRRLGTLEEELGYRLFVRSRGVRGLELTPQGQEFMNLAEKWKQLWREAEEIKNHQSLATFRVSAVDSVSTNIMPGVYHSFLVQYPEVRVSIETYHSHEAYGCVERGNIDLAFISNNMYSANIDTIPAFSERMLFVCGGQAGYPDTVHPATLRPEREIRVSWGPDYDTWHSYWFGNGKRPRLFLDKLSFFKEFLFWSDNWAIMPASLAYQLQESIGVVTRDMHEGPPDRLIYYLLGKQRKPAMTRFYLQCLQEQLLATSGVISLMHDL